MARLARRIQVGFRLVISYIADSVSHEYEIFTASVRQSALAKTPALTFYELNCLSSCSAGCMDSS